MTGEDITQDNAHRWRVRFDPTFNLGHVLSLIAMLSAGISAYMALDKRVVVVEQSIGIGAERSREQDVRVKEALSDLRSDMKDLQRSVNDVSRSLSATAARRMP